MLLDLSTSIVEMIPYHKFPLLPHLCLLTQRDSSAMGAFPSKDQRPICFELQTDAGREVFASVTLCRDNLPSTQCNLFQKLYRLRSEPHVRHWVNAPVARDQLKAPPSKDEVYSFHVHHPSLALDRAVSGDGGPTPLPILIVKLTPALLHRCLPRFCEDNEDAKRQFSWNGIRLSLSDLEGFPDESIAVAKVGVRAYNDKGIAGIKAIEGGFYSREYRTTGYATAFLQRACQLYLNGDQGLHSVPSQVEVTMLATDAWFLLFLWKLLGLLGASITSDVKLKLIPEPNPEKVTFLFGGTNTDSSTALRAAKKLANLSFPITYRQDVMTEEAVHLTKLLADQREPIEMAERHFHVLLGAVRRWEASNAALAQYEPPSSAKRISIAPLSARGSADSLFPQVAALNDELQPCSRLIEALDSVLLDFKATVKRILKEAANGPLSMTAEESLNQISGAIAKGLEELEPRLKAACRQAESLVKQALQEGRVDSAFDELRDRLRLITAELRSLRFSCEDIQWTQNTFSTLVDLPLIGRASRLSTDDQEPFRLAYNNARQGRLKAFLAAMRLRRHRTHRLEILHVADLERTFASLESQTEAEDLKEQSVSLRQRLLQLQELDEWLGEYVAAGAANWNTRVSAEPDQLREFQDWLLPTLRWEVDERDFQVLRELKGKKVRLCREPAGAKGTGRVVVLKTFQNPQELRKEIRIMKQAHLHHKTESNIASFHYVFEVGSNSSVAPLLIDNFSYVMVMPYYPCSSADWFNTRIQKGEWKEFVRGLVEVTRGAQQLHAIGILHGDIKPDNILFDSEDGITAKARIIDFAESVETVAPTPTLTAFTEGFLAPESRSGSAPSFRTDIFALGRSFAIFMREGNSETKEHLRVGLGNEPFCCLQSLTSSMSSSDPNDRPATCEEIIDRLNAVSASFGIESHQQ